MWTNSLTCLKWDWESLEKQPTFCRVLFDDKSFVEYSFEEIQLVHSI